MLNSIKELLMSSLRVLALVIVSCSMIVLLPGLLYPSYENSVSSDLSNYVKEYAPYVRPLKTPDNQRYCSSSVVNYKGVDFTVTNNHCCDVGLQMFGRNEVRVGDAIEKVIHSSRIADICILTSSVKDSPIKLASREFEVLDKVLLMGYPRGEFLTPRYGHIIQLAEEICIPYEFQLKCVPSNFTSTISYGGNSGSPLLNDRGQIVNVLYAGHMFIHTYSITVPFFYLRAALEESYVKTK